MSGATLGGAIQGMPSLSVPLVDSGGIVGQIWYRFFNALFNAALASGTHPQTGLPVSAPPGSSIAGNEAALAAESAARIAGDTSLQNQINALSGTTTGQATQIANLQTQITTLQTQVGLLQAQIDSMTVGTVVPTATAGVGGILPAQVTGYLSVQVSGVNYKAPLYRP